MRRLDPRSVSSFLRSGRLEAVSDRVRTLATLSDQVRDLLPRECRDHCQVANIRDGALVLATDGPAWANRLRFLAPEIRKRLQEEHRFVLQEVRVIVLPRTRAAPAPQAPRAPLSPQSAEVIRQCADGTSDPALKAALQRLAQRRNRR